MRHPLTVFTNPTQPQRLGRDAGHGRVEVEQHQLIPLEPRFEADMPARRGAPPQPTQMPLPLAGAEPADRQAALEGHRPRTAQRHRLLDRIRSKPADLDPVSRRGPVSDGLGK
jgi:hypothetical protein